MAKKHRTSECRPTPSYSSDRTPTSQLDGELRSLKMEKRQLLQMVKEQAILLDRAHASLRQLMGAYDGRH